MRQVQQALQRVHQEAHPQVHLQKLQAQQAHQEAPPRAHLQKPQARQALHRLQKKLQHSLRKWWRKNQQLNLSKNNWMKCQNKLWKPLQS